MCCCACVGLCCAGASDTNLHSVGLLVVDSTVPGSPADGVLEPGDVLVRVQGEVVSHFLQLEELLDEAVGHTIELQLERGGKPLVVHLPVTDLHDVTPASMLELAGGSVHALSYQQARNNRCGCSVCWVPCYACCVPHGVRSRSHHVAVAVRRALEPVQDDEQQQRFVKLLDPLTPLFC